MMELNLREMPHLVVGSLMEVHKALGPGLLVEAYWVSLAHELRMREIIFKERHPVSVDYKGAEIETAFAIDFVVEDIIALHLYAVDTLEQVHKERLRNHLQLSGLEVGFMVNFDCVDFRKGGLKRLIVSPNEPDMPWRGVDDDDEDVDKDNVRRVHEW